MNRRTFLASGAASVVASALPRPVWAAGTDATIDALIAQDDAAARANVGSDFFRLVQTAPDAVALLGGSAYTDNYLPPGSDVFLNQAAVALIAWSLSNTSQHGFVRTVNQGTARQYLASSLHPDNVLFLQIARALYDNRFRQMGTVQTCLRDRTRWAAPLCTVLASDAYFAKAMARRAADPAGFTQYLHMQMWKARTFAGDMPGLLMPVTTRWMDYYKGTPWTIYAPMQAQQFNEQTFMAPIQGLISVETETGVRLVSSSCQPSSGRCHNRYEKQYTYGIEVANWLDSRRGRYSAFITGDGPDNKS